MCLESVKHFIKESRFIDYNMKQQTERCNKPTTIYIIWLKKNKIKSLTTNNTRNIVSFLLTFKNTQTKVKYSKYQWIFKQETPYENFLWSVLFFKKHLCTGKFEIKDMKIHPKKCSNDLFPFYYVLKLFHRWREIF